MRRVLMLTQWFEPEPTFKGLVLARELARRGYEVEVVTGFPNYPGGRLYPGYRISWRKREVIDGISVTRLPLYPSHDSSPLRRVLNYSSFAASSLLHCLLKARRNDVIYVYQLPTLGVVAAIVQGIRGTPFVLDVQDIWPDTLRASGMVFNRTVLRLVDAAVRWVYGRATGIAVQSEGFKRLLIERGVDPGKISLIHNWCDESSLSAAGAALPENFPPGDHFRIVFAGNMGTLQALDAVLRAAELLQARRPEILFVLIGGGVETESLKERARARGLSNVVFLPRVGMDRIGDYLRAADAVLVHLKNDPLFSITIPGKVQAYMSMGKPILVGVGGDAADLVASAGCGVAATPEDPESIAAAAADLASRSPGELRAMGERGRYFYWSQLSLSEGGGRFAQALEKAAQA
jgi:colanic acid biosynthesis glycosyl transferase WcaI